MGDAQKWSSLIKVLGELGTGGWTSYFLEAGVSGSHRSKEAFRERGFSLA